MDAFGIVVHYFNACACLHTDKSPYLFEQFLSDMPVPLVFAYVVRKSISLLSNFIFNGLIAFVNFVHFFFVSSPNFKMET